MAAYFKRKIRRPCECNLSLIPKASRKRQPNSFCSECSNYNSRTSNIFLSSFKTPGQNGGLLVLPFETGFQTSFAAISQDTGRVLQGFFLGSGFGTYITDFTRFKQPIFNQNPNLWALTFFRSSSLILELLATAGVLGVLFFIFLIYKIFKVRYILILFLAPIIASFLFPFSFSVLALFFILLGILSVLVGTSAKGESHGFYDVEIQLVALQKA